MPATFRTLTYLPAGFGATTQGGAGGSVHYVENLEDSGPGSLRYLLQAPGPKNIRFRVGGTITNRTPLSIEHGRLSIKGGTAPPPGITLVGEELRIQGSDVLIEHLRVRTGDVVPARDGFANRDAITIGHPDREVQRVVLNQCSLSFAVDENFSIVHPNTHDITVQNCLIAYALASLQHPKGRHSMSALIQGAELARNVSFHHNILAHGNQRNPKIAGARVIDFRQNLVYNWGSIPLEIDQRGNQVNIVENLFLRGVDSNTKITQPVIFDLDEVRDSLVYLRGNRCPPFPFPGPAWNLVGSRQNLPVPMTFRADQPFPAPEIPHIPMGSLQDYLRSHCGAFLPVRDEIDLRVVQEIQSGTGSIWTGEAYRTWLAS